ncbi:MAG: bifunctional ADP-dependent (S)-NAD(P)H-hydrate dehydratase/NAD(P)H-hydrate epimerase [Alkalinema sp. CACIAM 70d]|nr:MAG: bifunctional ADP-dependent (S)-NAD(P)H-hydrate dehydratase/NAD(P)H-hydrate epimerase [Alkalinema sp. CACIAM 70d]
MDIVQDDRVPTTGLKGQEELGRNEVLNRVLVTAAQMQAIEARVFAAGMPIAALMEKVAGLIAQRVMELYPQSQHPQPQSLRIAVLVGSGHNGGDALVVARELHLQGYQVMLCCPMTQLKDLTQTHLNYAISLGIPCYRDIAEMPTCDVWIDGLFGFGLDRSISGQLAEIVTHINQQNRPVVSIDLPSGIHTDTGSILGIAIRATHTLCLGLWKLGLLQDRALPYVGQVELIDFGLPLSDIQAVLGSKPTIQRITPTSALAGLCLDRPLTAHKYHLGHLLLVVGSQRYPGAAILAGLAAQASGVGMLSIAVPASLQLWVVSKIPGALVIPCPETSSGAIAGLPPEIQLEKYQAIAVGCGLTPDAQAVVDDLLACDRPLILDADGLNCLGDRATVLLSQRQAPTILTPHSGEFERLWPGHLQQASDPTTAVQQVARASQATVLLKGARVTIANPQGDVRINPASTPALARGGSGDVLTGLMGGLWAQALGLADRATRQQSPENVPNFGDPLQMAETATWWHAQAGILAARERSKLGVDPETLTQYLLKAIVQFVGSSSERQKI